MNYTRDKSISTYANNTGKSVPLGMHIFWSTEVVIELVVIELILKLIYQIISTEKAQHPRA